MILRVLLPSLLLLTTLPVIASAEQSCEHVHSARFCSGELYEGNACSEQDTVEWGFTWLQVDSLPLASVKFEGSYFCWRFADENGGEERFRSEDLRVITYANGDRVIVSWTSYEWTNGEDVESGCSTTVETRGPNVGRTEQDVGCPAGAPPKMDWGRVLP